MSTDVTANDEIVRGRLEALSDERIVIALPGTDYRIHLIPTVPASAIGVPVGKRIKGVIHARGLRMHEASGGGRFIEPVDGAPRIVAGTVLSLDPAGDRILIDVAAPMWVSFHETQEHKDFPVGTLVNCYVESGARFTPA